MCESEIITLCVGRKYFPDVTIEDGMKVELKVIEGSEHENHIGVFISDGVQVGSIVHNRMDWDIVDGILTNDMIIDVINDYEWIIVRFNDTKAYLKAIPKSDDSVSEDAIATLKTELDNYKDTINLMIRALDFAQNCNDSILVDNLKELVDVAIRTHNEKSNNLIELENRFLISKRTARVFDYSKEAAK